MSRFLCFLLMSMFLVVSYTFADDGRCPLEGNAYIFEVGNVQYELSSFECTFGPGCQSECDLWYGNFETGPLDYMSLPFVCEQDGDVFITVGEVEIVCALNSEGNLECLTPDVSGYHCTQLGGKIWCFPERPGVLEFDKEVDDEAE